jgi:hypothetical protein
MSSQLEQGILHAHTCATVTQLRSCLQVANAFGTSVGAKTLTLRQAVIIAACFEFTGAMVSIFQVVLTRHACPSLPDMFQVGTAVDATGLDWVVTSLFDAQVLGRVSTATIAGGIADINAFTREPQVGLTRGVYTALMVCARPYHQQGATDVQPVGAHQACITGLARWRAACLGKLLATCSTSATVVARRVFTGCPLDRKGR